MAIQSTLKYAFTDGISVRRTMSSLTVVCLFMVTALLLASCSSTKKVSRHRGNCHEIGELHIGHADKTQKKIINEALTWLGTPYKYAAQEKGKGTDCSGMVMKVYEETIGEKLPRNSAKQAEYCKQVDYDHVDAGDLVFFATGKDPERVSHVGIVVDNESFIHASSSKGVVVSKFANNYYQRTFKMFGRVPRNKDLVSEKK